MARDRSEKYRQSFSSMIRKIMDAKSDSEEWSDESLDENIRVVSSDGSADLQESHSTDADCPGEPGEETAVLAGDSLTLGSGRVSRGGEAIRAEGPERADNPAVYYTAEQLSKMQIRESKRSTSGTKGIIDPLSKMGKKKPVKKCPNFDD